MPRPDRRLFICDEAREAVDDATLSQLHDQREFTVGGCFVCGGRLPPELDEQVQVVVFRDPATELTIVNLSHLRCMPSAVIDRPLKPPPSEWNLVWRGVLRDHAIAAVLIWEMRSNLFHAHDQRRVDAFAERLRSAGFVGATDRLHELVAPVLRRWQLQVRDDAIILRHPSGNEDVFEDTGPSISPEWREALLESRRALLVYGTGFGLDRLEPARVDRVLQAGEAVCGVVPLASVRA